MITFETQEDFEREVISVIANLLNIKVVVGGSPFITRITVAITDKDHDPIIQGNDWCCL